MKKYWVVAWNDYYPGPGLNNVKATFENEADAEDYARKLRQNGWMYNDDGDEVLADSIAETVDVYSHVVVMDVSNLLGL